MSKKGIDASGNIGTFIEGEPDPAALAAEAAEAQEATEAKARTLGWVPKDEFRGDPEKWRDAEEFVRHGEEVLPVLRENTKKLHAKLDKQDARIAELTGVVKNFAEYHKKTEERAYTRALKKLKDEQLTAVDDGNTKKFKEIEVKIEDLEKDHKEKPATPAEPGTGKNPEFIEWQEDNPWYGDDVELSVYADQAGGVIAARNKGIAAADLYEKVAEEVKKKYPDKFQNQRRKQPSTVEGGDILGDPPGAKGKGYSDLPADARAACDGYVKEKLLTREQYVKDYFAE